jgi:hypothetical protein
VVEISSAIAAAPAATDAPASYGELQSSSASLQSNHRIKGQPKRLPSAKAAVTSSNAPSGEDVTTAATAATHQQQQQQQQQQEALQEPSYLCNGTAAGGDSGRCSNSGEEQQQLVDASSTHITAAADSAQANQQQQQQQAQDVHRGSMSVDALLQLLCNIVSKQPQLQHYKKWLRLLGSLAGQQEGTADAAVLLARTPALLLAYLQQMIDTGKYTPKTAADVVQDMKMVVLLQEVQALFTSAAAEALIEQLKAARAQLLGQQKQHRSEKADAALAALIAMAEDQHCGLSRACRQQQQQQKVQQKKQKQQQQQQQPGMTVQQLQQLLAENTSLKHNADMAITAWSKVCGSDEVAVLLRNFDALLQHARATHRASTCYDYMRGVLRVLQLQEVQQLLGSSQQQQALLEKVQAAKAEFRVVGYPAKAVVAAAAAHAEDAAAGTEAEAADAPLEVAVAASDAEHAAGAAAAAAVRSKGGPRKRLAEQQVGPACHGNTLTTV